MRRRTFVAAAIAVAVEAPLAGCLGGDEPPEEPEYDDWFGNVDEFDGFEDRTGADEVTVRVGAGDHGFRFDPPAVTTTPGTTVAFEWTGRGGEHNVQERDGAWENPEGLVSGAGHVWRREFTEPGTHLYECWPHRSQGMKGGIFVDAHVD